MGKLSKSSHAHLAHTSLSSTSTLDHDSPAASSTTLGRPLLAASSASSLLPPVLTDEEPLPRLVVFDLDYTLWPFWIDTHPVGPLKPAPPPPGGHCSAATDKVGDTFAFYPDVPRMLLTLPLAGVKLAVASRTHAPDLARELLKMLPRGTMLVLAEDPSHATRLVGKLGAEHSTLDVS